MADRHLSQMFGGRAVRGRARSGLGRAATLRDPTQAGLLFTQVGLPGGKPVTAADVKAKQKTSA
jgi:hypothetical protein